MAAALLVLLLAAAVLAACWKRLLGLAVSRFAHGKAFRLTVGQFFFGGLVDVRLRLHRGPVRELRISRIAVSLSTKRGPDSGSEDGSGAGSVSLWQALLNGHLLLPVSLHGVSVGLAPAPPKAAAPAVPTAAGTPAEDSPPAPGGAGTPEAAAPTDGSNAGRPGGSKKGGRQLRAPLLALAHLPLSVEGLTVVDEERGVQLRLDRLSLTLLSAQQLLLEGLSAGLLVDGGSSGGGSSGGSSGSSPASPSTLGVACAPASPRRGPTSPLRRLRGAQEAAPQVQPVFQMDRLLLEHQHDGSFSLQNLQLKGSAAAGASPQGTAGAAGSSAPHLGLQRLSLQLGATSLTVSKQLLLWVQHQQAVAAQSSAARRAARPQWPASSGGASAGKQQRLQRLLPLLPKEVSLEAQSCSVGTDALSSSSSSGGTGASSDSLPLQAAFGLQGICCRLARAALAGDSSSSSSSAADGTPLASVTAGWQRLSISLGAAAEAAEVPGQQLPSALVMSSSAAEWSLALAEAAPTPAASSSSGGGDRAPLSAAFEVSIGALHTDVCHPAVQPLVAQLRLAAKAAKAAKSASKSAGASTAGAAPAVTADADAGASSQQRQQPVAHETDAAPTGKTKRPPLLYYWRASISLGDGSRLLFTDAAGRCCWSSGLASCRLAVQSSSSGGGNSGSSGDGSSAASSAVPGAAGGLSGSFEVHGIEMHAVATAGGSLAGEPGAQQGQPPQMLAAKLLRVEVQHGPATAAAAAGQHPASEQEQQAEQQEAQHARGGTAVDATTAGVHLLVQQQQLATVASVILSLLPPPKAASLPGTPPRTGSDAASADAGVLMAAAAAAAAEAISPHGSATARQQARPRRPPPRLTFSCTDTLVLLPTSVAVPAEQAVGGALLLLPAAPALLLASVSGSFGGSGRPTVVEAEGCCLLYAEGPHSQRFPSCTAALKEQATVVVLSVDAAKFVQPPSAAIVADNTAGDAAARQLELGAVAVTADADALLCMAAVADSAAQQLMAALAAAPPRPASPKRRRPKAAKQPQPLAVHVGQLSVAQPMSAERDMVLEMAAVHAVVGASGGTQHSVRTGSAVLSMLGKPVLRWRQLATTLHLPPGDGRLQAQPLPEPWPAAAEDGGEGAGIDGVMAPAAEESGGAPAAGSPSWEAYQRARLGAWLQADAATAPGAASQSAAEAAAEEAAAAALGTGPASILDATLSGAELIVPHDGEPGPTQRYSELYFKALETAAQHHMQCLKQFQRQRRSSAAGAAADTAAGAGEASAGEAGGLPPPAQQEQQQPPQRRKRQLFPMQINLAAEDVALRFEHHPLEAWLASRGPLLQQMALQQHLWGEVAAAVQPADSASPLHAAMVESAFATVQAASQQAWDGLMHDLFQQYRGKLQRLHATEPASKRSSSSSGDGGEGAGAARDGSSDSSRPYSAGRPPPDLMRLSCSRLQGLVVICAGSTEARAAATAQIVAVDPPSQGVPMSKMLKLHVDACLADFEMRLAAASQPMVAATRPRLSGAAAVARQATLPPRTAERRLPVGAHRSVPIPVTIKGCRPVFKFYTDLRLDAETLSVCHSQGLEPSLALVGLAGKRLSPGDPDKTVARPPPIPWWDDLRYIWRGPTAAGIRHFKLTLAANNLPDVDATSERLEANVESLTARLLTGQYELAGQALRVTLHRSAGVSQLGGTLLALPFVEAPHLRVNVGVAPKLPGERSANEHHLFPSLHGPAPPGALQEPIYAGVLYKADSWDVTLEAELGQPGVSAAVAAAASDGAAAGPLPALLGPFSGAAAVGYLGGQQVHWMKQYVAMVSRLPPQLRQVSRRGSFFWRKPPSVVPKKGFGKMMQQFSLRIVAAPLEIVHFAADPSELSHGVRLHAPSCSYTARYLMNQPLPSFLKLPPHARASKARRPEPTRTITLGMEVEAGTVTVHKPDASGPGSDPLGLLDGGGSTMSFGLGPGSAPGTATAASQRASAASSAGAAAAAAAAAEGEEVGHRLSLLNPPAGEESSSLLDDLIAPTSARHQRQPTIAAGVVTVTQDALVLPSSRSDDPAADPLADALAPQGSRPIRVLISDCRVLVDQAARDAVWGAVQHLIGAFSASGATQRRRLAQAAAHQVLPTSVASSPSPSLLTASPSMPWSTASPAAQLQRHISESQRSTPLTTPGGGASMEFAGAAEAAAAAAAASGDSRVPSPTPAPSGDSSNELLTLLLQQQQAGTGAGAEGQEGGGAAGGEGTAGTAGTPAGSPALLHPGAELEDGEEEDAPLSSPADDIHGQLRYTVEVVDLQINAEAEAAQGRLLLAARSGRVQGLRIPDAALNVTALAMEQVSAYVTQTDVDPDAPVVWLQPTTNGYTVPAGQGMLPVRRIFEPIQISLRHSKVSSSSNAGGGGPGRPPRRPSRGGHRRSPSGVGPGGSSRGEELLFKVPELRAKLDSREFEVLTDVISWAQAPGPVSETVAAEGELLAELPGEEEAEEARRLYALVLQQLGELRRTTLQLRASLGLQAFASQLAAPGPGGLLLPALEVTHFLVADTADFVAVQFNTASELGVAMREHLAAASAAAAGAAGAFPGGVPGAQQQAGGSGGGAGLLASEGVAPSSGAGTPAAPAPACAAAVARQRLGERQAEQQQALLLRWVEDQEGGAFEALEKAKSHLLALKAVARKRQQKHSATRVLLQVDQLVWQLCTPSRDPFIQASIRRLSLDKFKNKDHSGFAKFGIHRIEVLDTQGVLGPGPGVPAGVILSVWNPDASWERDDMLRVVATMGVPTQTHIIYDHLDVIVHPLAFHLTEGLAVAFWEYFFPREDESKARAAAAFARSVAVPAAAAARHRRSATALPASGMADYGSHQGSPMPPASPARRGAVLMAAEGGPAGSQPSSGGQSPLAAGTPRGSGIINAGWRSAPSKLHRRSSSGALGAEGAQQQQGALSRQGTFERHGGAAAAAAAAEASLLAAAAETAAALAAGGMGPGAGGGSGSGLARLSAGPMARLQRTSSIAGAGSGRLHASRSSASLAVSEDAASRAAHPPHRKVRFVHVKINRAHCRATYEGYPLTFTDLKLVVDNRTYANIEGRWRDLFSKMKWDIVKSVVKSVAGLQGRKFKELLPEGFPGEEGEGGGRRKTGLLAQLTALSKGRKEGLPGVPGEAPLSEEELREQQKRRMLFGQSWPAAAAKAPQQAQQAQQAQQQGGGGQASVPASPARGGRPPAGGEAAAGGPGSAGVSPRGAAQPEAAAAAPGEIYSSLGAAASAAGPLASGAFGSRLGSLDLPAPPLHPEDSGGSMGPSSSRGGAADPAAAALLGGGPGGGGGSRPGLTTPRWAKSLASGAKKGLAKAKEALRDSLQE